jgi:hypothetical protein
MKINWKDVYTILVEECGAAPQQEYADDFIRSMLNECREYRFQGDLGFGGKCYFDHRRVWVSCYREDRTPERDAMIAKANSRLPDLYKRKRTEQPNG